MFPALGAPSRAWLGFRPSMPDSVPVIGPSRGGKDIILAFGHGHLGVTLAPITARMVGDIIAGRGDADWLKPYAPGRFALTERRRTLAYRTIIDGTRWTFPDLKELLAKASPARSGDALAGIAAESAVERLAAQLALADLPLKAFLKADLVPYEEDEVTRLIVDRHEERAFVPDRPPDGRGVPRMAAR